MTVLYSNNAASTLAATITNSTTSMSVASGDGVKFPAPSGGNYFFMTLVDTGGTIEIVKVTARTNDTMTIERGQDGTTASAFSAGSKVELRITKAMLDQLKLDAAAGGLIGSSANFHTVVGEASFVAPEVIGNCIAMGIATSVEGVTEGGLAVGWLASVVGSSYGTAIGMQAKVYQGAESGIAIGMGAETGLPKGIAIGNYAIVNTLGGTATGSIAIGENTSASDGGVAIGANTAAMVAGNVVVLNGTGSNYGTSTDGFYVKPIRDNTYSQTSSGALQYDSATGEIFYGGGLIGSTTNQNAVLGEGSSIDSGITASIAIGNNAVIAGGSVTPTNSIAIGTSAGVVESDKGIAIGYGALVNTLAANGVAFGSNAHSSVENSIAIGNTAIVQVMGGSLTGAIAIGYNTATQDSSVVIGANSYAMAPGNTVLLNGTGTLFTTSYEGFYVNPVRNSSYGQTAAGALQYDSATGEIFYAVGGLTGTTTDFDFGTETGGFTALGQFTSFGSAVRFGTAIGFNAQANGDFTTAVGAGSRADGESSTAVGQACHAAGLRNTAVGRAINVGVNNVVALGFDIQATTAGSQDIIAINGTADTLDITTSGFFAKPVRDNTHSQTSAGFLQYDSTTGEVFYGPAAGGDYLPMSGGTLTGALTVTGNLLLAANSGGSRTIGFSGGTNSTLVLQAGASSGTGPNIELTAAGTTFNDATSHKFRTMDGVTEFLAISSAGVVGTDLPLTRSMFKDTGYAYYNSNTTNALDYTNGSVQRWAPSTGAQTLSITNWPPSGNLGELLIEGVNLGAATITWPAAINWVKSNGSITTTFSSSGVTLQTSGTDFVVLWTRDAGTTIYGKVVR